jgi:hypothetical protein
MSQPMITRLQYDYRMPVHPVCDLFPLMNGSDLEGLENDIKENGLLHSVVIHEGQLVDGRNRILACQQAEVEPRYVEWRDIYQGSQTLARWMWAINAERRHLTVDQYVAAQVALHSWEASEAAKLKQIEAGKTAGRSRPQHKQLETNPSQPIEKPKRAPQVRTKLAEQLGVSEHKVQQAINVQKADPELLKKVAKGEVSNLREAVKKVRKMSPAKKKKRAAKRFDVTESLHPIVMAIHRASLKITNAQRLALLTELMATVEWMKGNCDVEEHDGPTNAATRHSA